MRGLSLLTDRWRCLRDAHAIAAALVLPTGPSASVHSTWTTPQGGSGADGACAVFQGNTTLVHLASGTHYSLNGGCAEAVGSRRRPSSLSAAHANEIRDTRLHVAAAAATQAPCCCGWRRATALGAPAQCVQVKASLHHDLGGQEGQLALVNTSPRRCVPCLIARADSRASAAFRQVSVGRHESRQAPRHADATPTTQLPPCAANVQAMLAQGLLPTTTTWLSTACCNATATCPPSDVTLVNSEARHMHASWQGSRRRSDPPWWLNSPPRPQLRAVPQH